MKPIAREVQRAIDETGVGARRLTAEEYLELRRRIQERFTGGASRWPLWESFKFPSAVHDPDAWRSIGEFVGTSECLLLFNPVDAEDAFEFTSGSDLTTVLGETFGFEFYVVDAGLSYCICHNHHDILLGAGAASTWVGAYRPQK